MHYICLMSPVLIGPDGYNRVSKVTSASKVNVFLKQHLVRGGLAAVGGQCTSPPTHVYLEPRNAAYVRTRVRFPETQIKSQVMDASNPCGAEMGEDDRNRLAWYS